MRKLNNSERLAVAELKKDLSNSNTNQTSTETFFAAQLLKKSRRNSLNSDYLDTRFILPTSNICERLFSKAGYGFNDRRSRLLPPNFEAQIFLNANSTLWSVQDVNKIDPQVKMKTTNILKIYLRYILSLVSYLSLKTFSVIYIR